MMCKKRMERCIARTMGLTLGLAMGLMFSMKAMAKTDGNSVTFGEDVKVNAISEVLDTSGYGGTASENYNLDVNAKVKGVYTYVHPLTGKSGAKVFDWATGSSSAGISGYAPEGYRSLSMQCEHQASYRGDTWTCSTAVSFYP